VTGTNGILIDRVSAVWTNGPSTENGGYGLYPVLCSNVVIRNSSVEGASDSGIYVGQSENALVHNNYAAENVAGIEIENTINADVFDNQVENNAGGILVFDLPIPGAQSGSGTRVFNNQIRNNNHDNFAPEGGIVALVPPGTGILVLATKQVEVFENIIENSHITGVAIFSYISIATMAGLPIPDGFDPFFSEVHIHDNQISKSGEANPNQTGIGLLLLNQFAGNPLPDLLTDGIFSPAGGDNGSLCIQNNGTEYFANLDMGGQPPSPSFDLSAHDCSMDPLPEVNVPI
jgi:parallel beta-helix repeat protein